MTPLAPLLACTLLGAASPWADPWALPPQPIADVPACPAGATPLGPAVRTFTADFTQADPPERRCWDESLNLDLSSAAGIAFEAYVERLADFSSLIVYFKSGDGWYPMALVPEAERRWHTVRLLKRDAARTEGRVAGWRAITGLRFALGRGATNRSSVVIANLRTLPATAGDGAVIVTGESCAGKAGKLTDCTIWAQRIAATLEALRVPVLDVADRELTAAHLAGARVAVLPYNPGIPPETLRLLKAFSERGGKILAAYNQSPEVTRLLGFAALRNERDALAQTSLTGFRKTAEGLAGQPDFSPQSSWMTFSPSGGTARVAAVWETSAPTARRLPALTVTPAGAHLGHVWLGGISGEPLRFMGSVLAELVPAWRSRLKEASAAASAGESRDLARIAALPARRNERRLAWCHSAWGLGGACATWDDSIRFLRDNGFTDILANLAWGGTAYYASAVLPQAESCKTRGDAFAQCQAACRRYGIGFHVWKVCWNGGSCMSEAFRRQLAREGRLQVDFGGRERTAWLCPSHPDNRRLEIAAMLELAHKGAQGVHFDYIRYPDANTCFCRTCRAQFERRIGRTLAHWPQDTRAKAWAGAWKAFRQDAITSVVRDVARRVRAECPGVAVSAAVFENARTCPQAVGQDWPAWCREGLLDFVCPMDYTPSPELFAGTIAAQSVQIGRTALYPGMGLSCWPDDGLCARRLAREILAVRRQGLDGFAVFNFDRRAERVFPILRCGPTAP